MAWLSVCIFMFPPVVTTWPVLVPGRGLLLFVSGPLFLLLVAVGDPLFSLCYLEGLGFHYVCSFV